MTNVQVDERCLSELRSQLKTNTDSDTDLADEALAALWPSSYSSLEGATGLSKAKALHVFGC